ncbi:Mss4-like protein [Artomyces pyxidatus]|uniref:Mss4-like protein n=1 Tax=Artomyces pyxidatus TaxID=48021 RepID=A0ACB8SIM7_9AGAM|nr:Mss4-like protein [Artomyces pyxidatus]
MRALYERAGFAWVGRSAVVHGSQAWYEMRWTPSLPEPHAVPPGVWEALQSQGVAGRRRAAGTLLLDFQNGLVDVAEKEGGGTPRNRYPLLCSNCGSLILSKGVGALTERESVQMEPPDHTHPKLAALRAPPAHIFWWLVTPSPMEFENIGFSKPVNTASEKPLKLLACAECDLGPVGWCEPGGTEFWVSCDRVSYRT